MTVDASSRLAALRSAREKRALEAAVVEAGLVRRAEQHVEEATCAARLHVDEARAKERELVRSLAGRAVPLATILRIQTELDRAAIETARLQSALGYLSPHTERRKRLRVATVNFKSEVEKILRE